MIYIGVFIGLAAALMGRGSGTSATAQFADARARMAYVDEAESSILTEGLKDYLSQYADMIDVEHDQASLQDALFFEDVDYILRIPSGLLKPFWQAGPLNLRRPADPAQFPQCIWT